MCALLFDDFATGVNIANDGVLRSLIDALIGLQNRFQLTFELNAALSWGGVRGWGDQVEVVCLPRHSLAAGSRCTFSSC